MTANSIFLASSSPRRRELLSQLGVEFNVITPDVDETVKLNESPVAYVERLAIEKAKAGLSLLDEDMTGAGICLGSDTSVVQGDTILGKPRDRAHAVEMLRQLSGNIHQVMTSVAIVSGEKAVVKTSITQVKFKELSDARIEAYCDTAEPMDKAGAYGIQGLGAIFVDSIEGSYSGVVGLPLAETAELLNEFNVQILEARL